MGRNSNADNLKAAFPKVDLREGGRFFPNAARSFHRNDPQIFLRVLEDVWKDYNSGRRSILSPKTFYSLEKFKKL